MNAKQTCWRSQSNEMQGYLMKDLKVDEMLQSDCEWRCGEVGDNPADQYPTDDPVE
ncbi:hypothetical protein HPP92_017504 [Vanilla planifolia]|uniref:Uncharacterized protein n=1 Tax=Vanilla planifolia TaxID=51239 RepID=A0A835UQM5_VANPL|nr:hypothetical protein HPP92_017504 [Vanilla planifolia]